MPPAHPGPPEPHRATGVPALRASDADRERVAATLRDAGGDGRLSVAELDERLDRAYAAVTVDELRPLTADLVAADADGDTGARRRVAVVAGDRGTRWTVAVMGGVDRGGTWRLARRSTSVSVMGGSDLDLTHVEFDGEEVRLTVVCVMGGADVRVPDHMNVVVSSIGIMGGGDVRIGPSTPDPGGPTLHLRLVSVMGGTTVRRGPRRPRRERQEQDRDDRERDRRQRQQAREDREREHRRLHGG